MFKEEAPLYILVTNDDGITSPGLLALRQALAEIAEVAVVAPERNWSASSHSRTLFDPLRARKTTLADGSAGIACSGTPADCVALAVMGLLERRPDLIVSGINQGANLAHDVLYSGTVAAAMEGILLGIPAVAVSLDQGYKPGSDFQPAAHAAAAVVRQAIAQQLPSDVLLNINVPAFPPEELGEIVVTRLGRRIYRNELMVRHDPHGLPYYWVGGEAPSGHLDEGTDVAAIANRQISVTPLHMDLTSHHWIEKLQRWNFS